MFGGESIREKAVRSGGGTGHLPGVPDWWNLRLGAEGLELEQVMGGGRGQRRERLSLRGF